MEDRELLQKYAESRSEAAFAELVARHVNLVYSTARRLVGDSHLAQDVAQAVFIDLARRPHRVHQPDALAGWLYRATQFAALQVWRTERRRRQRETEAMNRAELENNPRAGWEEVAPLLEEAMRWLKPVEMNAVVLRFFEGKSLVETGRALDLSENAAQKRITRALEKLRAHFARRGVAVSAGVLAAEIGANSVQAAPVGLAESLTGTSLAGAGATAEGVFLKIFLMSTQSKLLLASAIVLVAAIMGGRIWLFTRPTTAVSQKSAAAPTVAIAVALKPTAPVAQVEMPKLPPVAPSSNTPRDNITPATNNSPPGQREEIASTIKDMIARLKAGDTEGVLNDYGAMKEDASAAGRVHYMQSFEKHRMDMLTLLESLQTATPRHTLNPGGDADYYFYDITDPFTQQSEQFYIFKYKGVWSFNLSLIEKWDEETGDSKQTTFIQSNP